MSSAIAAICASKEAYSFSLKLNSSFKSLIVWGILFVTGPLCLTSPSKVSHVRFNPSNSKYFFSNI